MKLEPLGLFVPSRKSFYNKIAYFRRTLTQYSSEFSTKDLKGWAETLSGSTDEDEALVIGSIVDDSIGENGMHTIQMTVLTKSLVMLLEKSMTIVGRWHI